MNFFSVLDDSDNEEVKVVPKKSGGGKEAAAAPAKKDAAPAKKDAAPAKKDAAPTKKDASLKKDDSKPRTPKDDSGNNGGKVREPKVSHAASNAADADKEAAKENNRGGNRNRERHGEKHGTSRGAESGERRPKREFDRRSGTGRGREVSRGGRGAFGAGNPAQDAIDAEKDPKAAIEGAVDGVPDAPVDEEVAPAEEAAPAEPEPATFTLDEFMKKREEARQRAAAIGAVNVRTVNKDAEFAGMTTLAAALDDYVASSVTKAESGRKDQRSTAKNQVLNVGFKYPAPQPERERGPRFEGGRGEGRGEGRGGRREGGRGEGRGDRDGRGGRGAPRSAPASFNPADFPSL